MTSHRIHLFIFWDGNVYNHDLVCEWLEEVKIATMRYLGESTKRSVEHFMSRL